MMLHFHQLDSYTKTQLYCESKLCLNKKKSFNEKSTGDCLMCCDLTVLE